MKKIFRLGVMLALLLSLTACSSKLMDPILEQQQPVPQGNEASITFFRTSSFGGIIQAPIAEETASGLELVGISSMDTKIRHVVAPGKHIFVVGGESGSLLDADLAPQKHYYVKVSPGFGWGKYTGLDGALVTMDKFGASAPAKVLFEKFGFTVENVVNTVKSIL